MLSYTLRRLVAGLVLAVLVTLITYMLLSVSFDSIVRSRLGNSANDQSVADLSARLGFDRPVLVQYGEWLMGVFRGDLGRSFITSEPVVTSVSRGLSITLSIVLVALVLTAVVSAALGIIAGSRGGVVDRITQGISLTGMLVPGLLIAIGLVAVFAVTLRWLPATGFTLFAESPSRWLASITIPVIVLLIASIANMAALVRGAMIDELRKDYVRTLRMRGISARRIVLRHAFRNAASPALTVLGFEFLSMLGGAIVIEKIFAISGFGTLAFQSSLSGDVPVIMGITAFSVLLIVGVNLVIDIVNGLLNPKARVA